MSVVIIRIKKQIVVLCEYNNTPYKPTIEDCKTLNIERNTCVKTLIHLIN